MSVRSLDFSESLSKLGTPLVEVALDVIRVSSCWTGTKVWVTGRGPDYDKKWFTHIYNFSDKQRKIQK